VIAVDRAGSSARVAHEDIPGFMPAMTMTFTVRDQEGLRGLEAGDEIRARLVVTEEESWLEELTTLRRGLEIPEDAAGAATLREAEPGDAVPDVELVDQDGNPFRLSDLRGRAVALTFIFTRCPLPEFCPRMSRSFAAAERLLLDRPELRASTRLLSVSFDTTHDTPEVLREYGQRYLPETAQGFSHWSFVSGSETQVRLLAESLGLDFATDGEGFVHNLRTAVLDARGRVFQVFRGNGWQPEDLVTSLETALRPVEDGR
jgi:protein SCO1/2